MATLRVILINGHLDVSGVCVCVCVLSVMLDSCDPMDPSPPGSSVHGIFQTRILEWVPFPAPGDLLNPGIKTASPLSPALAGGFFATAPPEKPRWAASRAGLFNTDQQPSALKNRRS